MSATVILNYKYHAKGQPTKQIGRLYSDGVFRKNVTPHEHQLISPAAWCIDAPTFDDLERRNDKLVMSGMTTRISLHLYDTKNQVTWIISPKYFREHCGELDRGHGNQYFCPLKWWQSVCKKSWIPITITEKVKQERLI
jgi:hypothetical protein